MFDIRKWAEAIVADTHEVPYTATTRAWVDGEFVVVSVTTLSKEQ
jgi:hypothetical protein